MIDNTYLHNKNKLTEDQQRAMEKNFETYYSVIYRFYNPDGKEASTYSTSRTQKQMGKDILKADFVARTTIEIRQPYEIGFNYDIDGNVM
jgi:hypothetical protein